MYTYQYTEETRRRAEQVVATEAGLFKAEGEIGAWAPAPLATQRVAQ